MVCGRIKSEEISNPMQVHFSGEEDVSFENGNDDRGGGDDERSYRLGWKAMPLARDDLDSNYSHC